MNIPVNFELAKLLKEKGFDQKCLTHYSKFTGGKEELKVGDTTWLQFVNWNDIKSPLTNYTNYSAPTIAEVVMWLYEKHDVWVSPIPDSSSGHQLLMRKMSVHLFTYRNGLNVQTETLRDSNRDIIYFLSPTKAYEAAIEYTLKNLI